MVACIAMKRFFTLLLSLFPVTLSAQDLTGPWSGQLDLAHSKINLTLRIATADSGYTAKLDSPQQGMKGIPITSIRYEAPQLMWTIGILGVTYTGTVVDGNRIEGTFSQSGQSIPLNLQPGEIALNRPQEPKPPYPYRAEEVTFENAAAGVTLAGTLTLPEGKGKFPAVILVTGSGAQNRNEEILGHKPFLVLADYLTRRGIAVLRYDDRGFGESTGNFSAATTADFTQDALSAFEYLQARPEINRKKIGMAGHSEGGRIAFMAATENKQLSFIISMAGAGQRGDSILLTQTRAQMAGAGIPTGMTGVYSEALRKIHRILDEYSNSYIRERLDSLQTEIFAHDKENILPLQLKQAALQSLVYDTPWMKFFRQHDPAPYIRQTRCPVLAINGEKDMQVDAILNLGAIETNLRAGGNKAYKIISYPGLNHLFQHAETGMTQEYGLIEETLAPQVLEDITAWILSVTK